MIGEVWLCYGQSNMSMTMQGNTNQPVENAADILNSADNSQLRLFTVKYNIQNKPVDDVAGQWEVSDYESAKKFSAIALQFGQMLQKKLKVPVGIVVSSRGGSPIMAWMSKENLKQFPEQPARAGENEHQKPNVLYNGMINPLFNMSIKGFLWYQGENDRNQPKGYERLMPAMVKEWRTNFNQGELPFLFVQIAPYSYSRDVNGNNLAFMRESQMKLSHIIPNSAVAISLDAGSERTIHPPAKTIIAKRLYYAAMAKAYHMPYSYLSPEYKSMKVSEDKVHLYFNNIPMGITTTSHLEKGFEVASAIKSFTLQQKLM